MDDVELELLSLSPVPRPIAIATPMIGAIGNVTMMMPRGDKLGFSLLAPTIASAVSVLSGIFRASEGESL